MTKRFITRALLLIVSPIFVWDAPSRTWWARRFRNGGL